ncbi:Calcium-binding EF-hand family protein [Perilla frutescens var. hirtella]|uniref:Calcium-binding EF-hand family protein n=1 Tax=Perilla frutescens var. hirtella TaxID=608512 RepID=A0AAD4INB1_PERFH|nr:Calcium-binding EF-hand family protein [Perilla frutescens var. hirtella]
MVVVVIDGSTILSFVNDEARFKKSVDEAFVSLDLNNDGVLSRSELRRETESLRLIEAHFGVDAPTPAEDLAKLHDTVFDKFDCDKSGAVDKEEFMNEIRNILVAIAEGLGFCPVQMALEDEDHVSFLKQAADFEAFKGYK